MNFLIWVFSTATLLFINILLAKYVFNEKSIAKSFLKLFGVIFAIVLLYIFFGNESIVQHEIIANLTYGNVLGAFVFSFLLRISYDDIKQHNISNKVKYFYIIPSILVTIVQSIVIFKFVF